MAFIHSGINEKTVWLVLCVQKSTQKMRHKRCTFVLIDIFLIAKILTKRKFLILLLFIVLSVLKKKKSLDSFKITLRNICFRILIS